MREEARVGVVGRMIGRDAGRQVKKGLTWSHIPVMKFPYPTYREA